MVFLPVLCSLGRLRTFLPLLFLFCNNLLWLVQFLFTAAAPQCSPTLPSPYYECPCVFCTCVFLCFFELFLNICVCFYDFVCVCVGEEVKVGDIPKPSLPSILPKKPLPPKTSSSPSSLPPRRPEKPPTLASVHTHTHMLLRRKPPTYL